MDTHAPADWSDGDSDSDFGTKVDIASDQHGRVTPNTPGYCYLALFDESQHAFLVKDIGAYPPRCRVEVKFLGGGPPTHAHPGPFRLTFGTRTSALKTQKLLAHVERVPDGQSLLRVTDVFALMPSGSRFGDGQGDDAPTAPLSNSDTAPPISALGTVPDPTVRRFYVNAVALSTGTSATGYYSLTLDPVDIPAIAQFIAYSQHTVYESLSVHFVPTLEAPKYHVMLQTAWYPSNENAPNGEAGFQTSPSHLMHYLGSAHPQGRPDALSVSCVMGYGIQRVAKPTPHFGGVPRFALRFRTQAVGAAVHAPQITLYHVVVEAVLNTRPLN